VELPALSRSDAKTIAKFVTQLAEKAELTFDEIEALEAVPRIMHAGLYQLGVVAEEIHNAIRVALRRGDGRLTLQHFGEAFANRTGNLSPFNPYLADRWADIDASRVLAKEELEKHTPKKGSRR
jgi:hypothetical protein